MNKVSEAAVWRNIVDATPEERVEYNGSSLTDYLDIARDYFTESMEGADKDDMWAAGEVVLDLSLLMDEYMEQFGALDKIWVQGNGLFLPDDSNDPQKKNKQELKFLDGSRGITGEYDGFSVCLLPSYQNLIYKKDDEPVMRPTLCIELANYSEYISTEATPEPSGKTVSIPIIGQDLCFLRG